MLLTIDQATSSDLPMVLSILDEAAAWLKDQGIEQWPDRFSSAGDWRVSRIAGYVDEGDCWLVRAGGDPIATFNLTERADPDYADGWPDGAHNALYIYRMAVRRAWSGRDIGGRILEWACAQAHATGALWLRLDCHRRNRPLQRYYEAHGFLRVNTLVRVIDDAGTPYTRGSGALYQRPAATLYHPSPTEGESMTQTDFYDPQGEAAIWNQAATLVMGLKRTDNPDDPEWRQWNAALEQAARVIENEGRAIRQRNGMYYRVISGQPEATNDEIDTP